MTSAVARAALDAVHPPKRRNSAASIDDLDARSPPIGSPNGASHPLGTEQPHTHEPLEFLEPAAWAGQPVPEQQWLVRNRIPRGTVTILSGDGGTGKSLIALQLASATLRGADWLGAMVEEPGPAIFYSAEEPADEIHRRLARITERQGIGLSDLTGMSIVSRADQDATLGAANRSNGIVRPTPLFHEFVAHAVAARPSLIIVENAADVFACNENDRAQARQSIGLLRRLALKSGAAVLLLVHPSLTGLATKSGMSGSTAWNNSARSRMYLSAPSKSDAGDPDSDIRQLEMKKANYGPIDECVSLRWDRGIFVLASAAESPQQLATERAIERAYLDCLDKATASNMRVYPHKGRGYAASVFEPMPEAAGFKLKALAAAQARLMSAGAIHIVTEGPPSKLVHRVARKQIEVSNGKAE